MENKTIYAGAAPNLRHLRTREWRFFPLTPGMKVLLGGASAYYALLALGTHLFLN
jgi:hypothetical protein